MNKPAVKIIRYNDPIVSLYLYDALIGTLNNYNEYNKVAIQIAENSLEGYSIHWNGKVINITTNGELSEWPYGLYDEDQKDFRELILVRKAKLENKKEK